MVRFTSKTSSTNKTKIKIFLAPILFLGYLGCVLEPNASVGMEKESYRVIRDIGIPPMARLSKCKNTSHKPRNARHACANFNALILITSPRPTLRAGFETPVKLGIERLAGATTFNGVRFARWPDLTDRNWASAETAKSVLLLSPDTANLLRTWANGNPESRALANAGLRNVEFDAQLCCVSFESRPPDQS